MSLSPDLNNVKSGSRCALGRRDTSELCDLRWRWRELRCDARSIVIGRSPVTHVTCLPSLSRVTFQLSLSLCSDHKSTLWPGPGDGM